MRRFYIDCEWFGYSGETISFDGSIDIEEEVIEAVNDEWRQHFYPSLKTPQDVAEHIAFNIIVNKSPLSMLEGFANWPDSHAKVIRK